MYLAYRERTAKYRERLYERQLDGFAEVLVAFDRYYKAALYVVHQQPHLRFTDETRGQLRSDTVESSIDFYQTHTRWSVFLPRGFNDAIAAFTKIFNAVSAPSSVARQYDPALVYTDDPGLVLSEAYQAVVQAARREVGTEALSRETLRVIGVGRDEE